MENVLKMLLVIDIIACRKLLKMILIFDKNANCKVLKMLMMIRNNRTTNPQFFELHALIEHAASKSSGNGA